MDESNKDDVELNVLDEETLQAAAEGGDLSAMQIAAVMAYRGWFEEKDLTKAFRWFLKAAEKGDGACMAQVAYMLEHGEGCKADPAQSAEWYAKAAKKGFHGPEARIDAKVWDVDGGE